MQTSEVRRTDSQMLFIGGLVAIGVILAVTAWALWPREAPIAAPISSAPVAAPASSAGMGNVRADEFVSVQTGMGEVREADALSSIQVGMGNLRAVEAGNAGTPSSLGMGDLRLGYLPGNALTASLVDGFEAAGMGDVRMQHLGSGEAPTPPRPGMGDVQATR